MSPRRRVLSNALVTFTAFFLASAAPASAQYYDAVRGALGFTMDGIERSPRLLGMGRMTYVGEDLHTRLTLWDFAGNPVGILDADSVSTAEVYPSSSSYSDVHDLAQPDEVRQDLAAQETRLAYEVWRRQGRTAYGIAGALGYLRTDYPYDGLTERRSSLRQPSAMPVMTGHIPYVRSSRWLYTARLFWSGESSVDQYRDLVRTSMGDFIDQNGTEIDPPEPFSSTDVKVRTTGAGFGLGYDRGARLRAAVNVDFLQNMIKGANDQARHLGQRDEKRPYKNGQATAVGRLGRNLAWGLDGHTWSSHSEEHWFFSTSGGVGGEPLVGRGKLLERDETGRSFDTKLRWTRGRLEIGGGFGTAFRRVTITPPGLTDLSSFNYFRNVVTYKSNADSIVLPDSVVHSVNSDRSWNAGLGALVRLPRHFGSLGVEYHLLHGLLSQDYSVQATLDPAGRTVFAMASQEGPLRKGWDVRTGYEVRLTPVMSGRAGYMYRWLDRDGYTAQNEYKGHTMTLGFGIQPTGATWVVDAGYSVEWLVADYGDPWAPRATRQQLATMLRWVF